MWCHWFCFVGLFDCYCSYTISPDDIEPDEDVKITLYTTLTEKVTSGTIKLVAKVDKFPVLDQDYDLCEEIQQANLTCPLVCSFVFCGIFFLFFNLLLCFFYFEYSEV